MIKIYHFRPSIHSTFCLLLQFPAMLTAFYYLYRIDQLQPGFSNVIIAGKNLKNTNIFIL